MIAGFATLAIVHFQELGIATATAGDFDRILPAAIYRFAPPGVLGLIIAGLLAAFVSTFAATLNAAPAYLVNDVYRRRINPKASRRAADCTELRGVRRGRRGERGHRRLHPEHQLDAASGSCRACGAATRRPTC